MEYTATFQFFSILLSRHCLHRKSFYVIMIAFEIWFGFQLFFEFSSVFLESIFNEKRKNSMAIITFTLFLLGINLDEVTTFRKMVFFRRICVKKNWATPHWLESLKKDWKPNVTPNWAALCFRGPCFSLVGMRSSSTWG